MACFVARCQCEMNSILTGAVYQCSNNWLWLWGSCVQVVDLFNASNSIVLYF